VHGTIRVFKLTERDVTLAEEDAVQLRKQHQARQSSDGSEDLDFEAAFAAHQQWRVTLRNAVSRKLSVNADELRRDDCCNLGKWLHGAGGKRWGHEASFVRLIAVHRDFHQQAGKVADVLMQQRYEQAGKMLDAGTPFVEAGKQVAQVLKQLRSLVEGEGSGRGASQRATPAVRKSISTGSAPKPAPAPRAQRAPTPTEDAGGDWETF
jgi:aerotaxis receptor